MTTALLLAFASTATAQDVQFDGDVGLPVRIDGRVVLHAVSEPISGGDARRIEGDAGLTLLRPRARQEFAVVNGRGEYTFEYHLPKSDGSFVYELRIPLEKGTTVRLSHGSYRYTENTTFTIGDSDAGFSMCRFLEIDSPRGSFAIDLDPLGSWQTLADHDIAIRTSRVRATDDGIELLFARGGNTWGGGRIMAKLVFYSEATPFEEIHPFNKSSYKTPVERQHFLDFGNRGKDYATGLEPFDDERGFGWVDPTDGMRIVNYAGNALYHSALVRGEQSATFRLKAEPGWHLLTLQFGDREQPVGPMNVRVNGAHRIIGFELEPARFTAKRMVVETDDAGIIDIELSGRPWSIDGLVLQPLLPRQEDYLFTRSWWNQDIDWP